MYRILAYDTEDGEMMMDVYERVTKDLFSYLKNIDKLKTITNKNEKA
jgi:hypothetical protein